MQTGDWPQVRDLVLVGGGHAHALVLRMWGMAPLPGVRLTLVNPGPIAPYTGMLPGHIAGHYARTELMIDLVRLTRFAGARLVLDRATGIDRAARLVHLQNRPPLRYDLASLDVGIASDLPDVPGFAEHGVAAKPLGTYAERWEAFLAGAAPEPAIAVIGAGVGGVELALASMHRLRAAGRRPSISLIEQAQAPLAGLGAAARARLLGELERAGIAVLVGSGPRQITATEVQLHDGRRVPSQFTLSVAGARAQGWLARTGLVLQDGHVVVGPTLVSSDPAIFAAGDCAHLGHAPRPKAGVYAVRAAPVLLDNLRASLSGGTLRPYHPQRDYLKLVSLGDRRALADRSGLRAGGAWLWRWKDRIDRRFMDRLADLPAPPAPQLPARAAAGLAEALAARPLCGGCGAKLGPGALTQALERLPPPHRPDVLSGAGDDAAVLAGPDGQVQVISTDHLRAFLPDPWLMARVAAIHALGDVWAMGAAPQAALAQIVLPKASPALHADMLREVMEAAAAIFAEAGAEIVGGHTSIGSELTVGFTVTGLAPRALTKAGAQAGDRLILTKPLGTGTILAAEMARARLDDPMLGEAMAAALASMQRPLGPAAAILRDAARAMTDVTGFGLAGHLLEMMQASGTAARLHLGDVPLLPGALALAEAGHASSLAPDNLAAVSWRMHAPPGSRASLLVDPQTAGGLLAAVPADQARALLVRLLAAGETAAIIGMVEPGLPGLTVDP